MRKSLFLILLLSSLIMLSACTGAKEQSLEEFYKDAKIENVDKVILQDGTTGDSESITDQRQLKEFLTLIKNIEFTQEDNQKERKGWLYGITIFDGEKEFKFTLSQIGATYYKSNPDIYPIVDNYYKQLKNGEKWMANNTGFTSRSKSIKFGEFMINTSTQTIKVINYPIVDAF